MKKFIFMMIAMFGMAIGANAQESEKVRSNFLDNWSIGVDGGVSSNLHDWDTPNGAVVGLQITKGITPVVSFEFSGQLGFNDNANWNVLHSANAIDNVTVLGSTKINLMNWFCGYNGKPRLFEIQARGGVGYMRGFYPDYGARHGSTDLNCGVAKLGFDFDFNLGKQRAWTVSLRPSVVLRTQNGVSGCDYYDCSRYTHNAVGQLTAGVTYHFKNKTNANHYFTYAEPKTVTEVVEKVVERPVTKVVEKTVTKTDTVTVEKFTDANANSYMVNFPMGSSTLTTQAKKILDGVDATKASVVAFASPEGSAEKNQVLSQKRADAVSDYLKARGIDVVSSRGGGVTGPNSGRIAIVTATK